MPTPEFTVTVTQAPFPQVARWVVFSDLHCTTKTLDTCLDVLDFVHDQAVKREAGIIFLGDFWTERGRLPTAPLNAVIDVLRHWTQPTIWLPGNHDQVDLGGLEHGIAPLAACNPLFTCIDEPEVDGGALWVPYRRRSSEVVECIAAHPGLPVFCHIDVIGAFMNDAIQAGVGIMPSELPGDQPIWTGHYHKPHRVELAPNICYVGSPYQTSHHEAGQAKRLLVLDNRWQLLEEIPIDIGARYFHARMTAEKGWQNFPEDWREGDRITIDAEKAEVEWTADDRAMLDNARQNGLTVEIRVSPTMAKSRIDDAGDLAPEALWAEYGDLVDMAGEVRDAGVQALRDVDQKVVHRNTAHCSFRLERVHVKGYGVFADPVVYPLADRGAVLVTGQNLDMPGAESNGSGKSTIMCAALWCLTGESDPRPDGASMKGLGKEMVNDACDDAEVEVHALVDGRAVVVKRQMGKGGHKLTLMVDGDASTSGQDADLTQQQLDRIVDTNRISRTVFFSQHEVAGFLDATDKGAKDSLTEVVNVDLWVAACEHAAGQRKTLAEQVQAQQLKIAAQQAAVEAVDVEGAQGRSERFDAARATAIGQQEGDLFAVQGRRDIWLDEQQLRIQQATDDLGAERARAFTWGERRAQRVLEARDAIETACLNLAAWDRDRSARVDGLRGDLDRYQQQASQWVTEHLLEVEAAALEVQQLERLCTLEARDAANEQVQQAIADKEAAQRSGPPLVGPTAQRGLNEAGESLAGASSTLAGLVAEGRGARQDHDAYAAAHPAVDPPVEPWPADRATSEQQRLEKLRRDHVAAVACLNGLATELRLARAAAAAYADLHGQCDRCLQAIDETSHAEQLQAKRQHASDLDRQHIQQQHVVEDLLVAIEATDRACRANDAAVAEAIHATVRATKWSEVERVRGLYSVAAEQVKLCQAARDAAQEQLEQARQQDVQAGIDRDARMQAADETLRVARDAVSALMGARDRAVQARRLADEISGRVNPRSQQVALAEQAIASVLAERNPFADAPDMAGAAVQHVEQERCPNDQQVQRLEMQLNDLERHQNPYTAAIAQHEQQIAAKRAEQNPWTAEVVRLQAKQQAEQEKLAALIRERDTADHASKVQKELETHLGRNGVQNFILEAALQDLQSRAQRYLDELSDGYLRLALSATSKTQAGKQTEKLDRKVLLRRADGTYVERKLKQLSGGERRRIIIAVTLAFAEFCAARTGLHSELVAFDEVFQHLDGAGRLAINKIVRGLRYRTVLVITHDQDLASQFDHVDIVTKRGDRSTVQVDA